MSLEEDLSNRSGGVCELCGATHELSAYEVSPSDGSVNEAILVCETCKTQLQGNTLDANHFRCLNDSMWSTVPAVQVVAYRTLHNLSLANESWAGDLLEMLYLDDELKAWANKGIQTSAANEERTPTKDSNGSQLLDGDSVTIIKDLDVKGANFVAKRGTLVKNISLTDNPEHIEGKVNGTRIVLLSCFLKKV
jgi:protein PhnA